MLDKPRPWEAGTAYEARFRGGPMEGKSRWGATCPGFIIVVDRFRAQGRYALLVGDEHGGDFVWIPPQRRDS